MKQQYSLNILQLPPILLLLKDFLIPKKTFLIYNIRV